jgi:hypothetical protein
MRALLGAALLVVGMATLAGSASAEIHEVDYATWDVTLTDSKGVVTEMGDFGFWTGPNILVALRGDAKVRIPFRRIRTLEIGAYQPVQGYSPATVTTNSGQTYKLELERFEGQRFLGGKTEFGSMRIRLMQIRKLHLKRLSHTDPDFRG